MTEVKEGLEVVEGVGDGMMEVIREVEGTPQGNTLLGEEGWDRGGD